MHILQDGHEDAVYCVDFDPTADFRLISGSLDKTIRLWDLREERCLAILQGHTDFVLSALFMRDGLRVISGSKDRCVLLWDLSPCLNDSGQDGGPTMLKPIGCVASFSNSGISLTSSLILLAREWC
jgi:WD40 repeat protein